MERARRLAGIAAACVSSRDPKAPRRVSGPVGGTAAQARRHRPAHGTGVGRGSVRPAHRATARDVSARSAVSGAAGARSRTGARVAHAAPVSAQRRCRSGPARSTFVRTLPDHRLLDRLIRGRAWIPLLGVMLVGIVAMQVEVLKLGASIGRSIQRTSNLQTKNEMLRETVASLDGDARIESLAAAQGMVMPAPGGVGFLSVNGAAADVGRTIANIHAPDAAGFLALTSPNGTVATSLNSSASGTATALTVSATSAGALAQTASQTPTTTPAATQAATPAAGQSPVTTPVQTTAPATTGSSTGTATGSPATGTTSTTGTAVASGTTGTSGQVSGSPSASGQATPVTSPTQTSSGASTTGGASVPVGG